MSLFARRREPPQPEPQPVAATDAPTLPRLVHELEALSALARREGGRLPVGASVQFGALEDVLYPLLQHLGGRHVAVEEELALTGIISDYLPSTLTAYLGIPPMLLQQRNRLGRTAEEELLNQLTLLLEGARETALALYQQDALQLATQGRFLESKFGRTDLEG